MARRRRTAAELLAFTTLLVLAVAAGRATRLDASQIALVWPVGGVAVWVLHRVRPAGGRTFGTAMLLVVGSAFAVNLTTGSQIAFAFLFAGITLAHAVVGSWALRRFLPTGSLRGPGDVASLLGIGWLTGACSGLLAATASTVLLAEPFMASLILFTVRNAAATFDVLLVVLSLSAPYRFGELFAKARRIETCVIAAVLAFTYLAVLALSDGAPLLFLALAVSVWAGVRVGVARSALLATSMCLLSVAVTARGVGAIADVPDLATRAIVMQVFILVVLFVSQSLATLQAAGNELATRLDDSLRVLRTLSDAAPIGTVRAVRGLDGGWVLDEANPAAVRLLGTDPAGRRWGTFVADPDRPALRQVLEQIADGARDIWDGEVRHRTEDGALVWTQLHVSRLSGHDHTTAVVVQLTDITARRGAQDRLAYLAEHDSLTGLPNRARLHADLDRMIHTRSAGPVAVFFLDLDRFKAVNDTLGHDTGDLVLTQVGACLRDALRPGDLVSRLGGDEFVVCCQGIDSAEARMLARRLQAVVAPALRVGGAHRLDLGVSVGYTEYQPGDDVRELLRRADAAMYANKLGRDRPCPGVPQTRGSSTATASS